MSEWISGKIDYADNLRKHEARVFALMLRESVLPLLESFSEREQQAALEVEIERLLKVHDEHSGNIAQRAHEMMSEVMAMNLIPRSIMLNPLPGTPK